MCGFAGLILPYDPTAAAALPEGGFEGLDVLPDDPSEAPAALTVVYDMRPDPLMPEDIDPEVITEITIKIHKGEPA